MDKYQKIKDFGLEVFDGIDYIKCVAASDLLEILEAGVEVYGQIDGDGPCHFQSLRCLGGYAGESTHTGIIINIKPLKPKEVTITREDLETAFSDGLGRVDTSYFEAIAKRLGL